MKRTTKITAAALSLTMTLAGTTALAGLSWGTEVTINWAQRTAEGTMGTVRGSSDSVQQIGCALRAATNGTLNVVCQATNSANQSVQCSSTSAHLVQAAQAMTSNSHLIFTWNAANTCTSLYVENYSSNAPISP